MVTIHALFRGVFVIAMLALLSCAYHPPLVGDTCRASTLYQMHSFAGTSLSGETVLILPILTRNGPDTLAALSAREIGKLLKEKRGDVEPILAGEFEAHCKALFGPESPGNFYKQLYASNVVAVSNSDSVWKQMKTGYCSVTRIAKGLRVRGLEGVLTRRMTLETELWSVDSTEAVWRAQVECVAKGERLSDADLVREALRAAFDKIPVFAPENNERNW